jgi:hypothetical protein
MEKPGKTGGKCVSIFHRFFPGFSYPPHSFHFFEYVYLFTDATPSYDIPAPIQFAIAE